MKWWWKGGIIAIGLGLMVAIILERNKVVELISPLVGRNISKDN